MAHILTTKKQLRKRRHARVRGRVTGSSSRPRLAVFRSNTGVYAQVIDDSKGVTLVSASSRALSGTPVERARAVGTEIAKRAQEKGIASVVFDRGGFAYAGAVRALAEGARSGGLAF